jgi:stage V sporulation protein K
MSVVLTDSRDDVFRFLETGTVSPAQVVEFMRTSSAPALKVAMDEEHRNQRIRRVMDELDELVGLNKVKKTVQEIYAFVEVQRLRRDAQLLSEPQVLHMVFRGNPGCVSVTCAEARSSLLPALDL